MEVKKGFLAIGIICIFLVIGCILFFTFGTRVLSDYYIKYEYDKLASTYANTPYYIDIDRNSLKNFLSNLGYVCSEKEVPTPSFPVIHTSCSKTEQGIAATVDVVFISAKSKPVSITVSVPLVDTPNNRIIIEKIFREIVQIPYIKSEPETAITWLDNNIMIQGNDSFSASRNIGNATFSIGLFVNISSLSIGPAIDE